MIDDADAHAGGGEVAAVQHRCFHGADRLMVFTGEGPVQRKPQRRIPARNKHTFIDEIGRRYDVAPGEPMAGGHGGDGAGAVQAEGIFSTMRGELKTRPRS